MNAERELTEAYREWRRLSEAEGEAIGAADWTEVFACQQALKELQGRIARLTPAAKAEWSKPGSDRAAKEKALNTAIYELISIQRRNQTVIHTHMEAARARLDQLGLANRNLKQIHQSYTQDRAPIWTSLS